MGSIPPFIQQIIGAGVRIALVWLASKLASRGIVVSDSQVVQVTAAASTLLATFAWSLYSKYVGRQKLLTAAASTEVLTEHEIEARVSDPTVRTPSVLTPKAALPR